MVPDEKNEYVDFLICHKIKIASINKEAIIVESLVDNQVVNILEHVYDERSLKKFGIKLPDTDMTFKEKLLKLNFVRQSWLFMKKHRIFRPVVKMVKLRF